MDISRHLRTGKANYMDYNHIQVTLYDVIILCKYVQQSYVFGHIGLCTYTCMYRIM